MASLEPIVIPVKLGDLADAKKQLRELKTVADDATAPNQAQAANSYKKLAKEVKGVEEAFKKQTKTTKDLTKEYIRNEEGMIEVTSQISLMEDKMYDLVLSGQANSEEFIALRAKTAEFKAIIIETDKEIDLLAENKGLGAIGGGLGQIGERLVALDFEGAAKDASLLNKQMGSLGAVGKKSISGLAKTVGQLSKAFIKFGVSLLANPIFLLVTVIVAIVAAVAVFLDKLGVLQPILDAIGTLFGWIADAIELVVQGFKDMTDWIGITDFAGEEAAQNEIDRIDKVLLKMNELIDTRNRRYDEELAIAQARGEDTIAVERKKLKFNKFANELQNKALKRQLEAGKEKGILDEDEIEALREKIKLTSTAIKQSRSELRILRVKEEVAKKKGREEEAKEEEKAAKDGAQRARQFAADRLQAERRIRSLTLETIEDGADKELAINAEKYSNLIEDTKRNEKLLLKEKTELVELLEAEKLVKDLAINKKANDEKEKQNTMFAELVRSVTEEDETDRIRIIEEAAQEKIDKLTEAATEEQRQTAEFRGAINDIIIQKDAELTNERALIAEEELRRKLELSDNDVSQTIDLLDKLEEIELASKESTEVEKLLIEQKFAALRDEARAEEVAKEKEKEEKIKAGKISAAEKGAQAIFDLNDLVFELRKKNLVEGSVEEERAARKNFEINKKLQIGQAVIQGVQATLAAFSSGAAVPVVGAVLAPLYAGAAALAASLNIAKIKNSTFGGGGSVTAGGGGGVSAGSIAATSTAIEETGAPDISLFGSANDLNNVSQTENVEANQTVTIKAQVIANDITDVQVEIKLQDQGATL